MLQAAWLDYSSTGGKFIVKISNVDVARDSVRIGKWLESDLISALDIEVKDIWLSPTFTGGGRDFAEIWMTPRGVVGFNEATNSLLRVS